MDFTKLDEFMMAMPERGVPGCELAISKNGKTVYRTYVGYSDFAKTKPVCGKDIYWIYSATKVITCLAAMTLVDEGKLDINDPVSKYIPEFADVKIKVKKDLLVPVQNEMRIIHLFTMTSGMSYDLHTPAQEASEDKSTLGLVRAMAKDPLRFEPGTHYRYSLSHDVLAAVIEVITGMRYSEYLETKFFKPLGIKDMGFRPSEEQKSRFAAMYDHKGGTATAEEREGNNIYILSPEYDSGGAGLFSTVDEYMKIISVIANGGATDDGYRIMKPETIAMMQKNYLCPEALNDFVTGRFFGYGFGLCGRVHMNPTVSCSLSPVGEFGWDGAAGAFSMIDPVERVALYFGVHCHCFNYGYNFAHGMIRNLAYEGLRS